MQQFHRITSIIENALEERVIRASIFLDVTQAFHKGKVCCENYKDTWRNNITKGGSHMT